MKLNSASPFLRTHRSSAARTENLPHLREVVAHLHEQRAHLCADFARGLLAARWLTPLGEEDIRREAELIYDEYVAALESGCTEALQDCATHVSDRLLARGLDIERILGIVRTLRNLVIRSLFDRFRHVANWNDSTGLAPGSRRDIAPRDIPHGWRVMSGRSAQSEANPNTASPIPA